MNKLMVLGAAYSQIPLFEAAKKLGVRTVAVSIPGDYSGFHYADEVEYADIADPEACIEAARKHQVTAVATVGLDLGMRSIGAVAEALGLIGPSREAALTVSDKYLMKQAFIRGGVRTAPFFCIHNEAELEEAMDHLTFPLITKAVDQMGSRGIYKCGTKEEARRFYKESMSYTKKDYCLIEEFIEGTVFCVEGMVQRGELLFCMPNNSDVLQLTTKIPIGHSVPFAFGSKMEQRVVEVCKKAIKAVQLDDCPVDFDCIIRDGEIYLVEMTGRPGGAGLSEVVSNYYDINYYESIVKLACGMEVASDFSHKPENVSVLASTLLSRRCGVLQRIRNYNLPDERIKELSFNVQPGSRITAFSNSRDRTGQVVLKTESLEESYELLQRINDNILYEMEGDIPIPETFIHKLGNTYAGNQVYAKRDDTLPFSFGGNKVRFADAYLRDMEEKGCDAMVIYGGYTSNLCRILSAACIARHIPCSMIYNTGDSDPTHISANAKLIRGCNVKEYICTKANIADTVDRAMEDFRRIGRKPYYIHGNRLGQGNITIPMDSYVKVYYEICRQELEMNLHFDYIFIGSGTNTSHCGLLAGHLMRNDERKIVGLSVTRPLKRGMEVLRQSLQEYAQKFDVTYPEDYDKEIIFTDEYIAGGYGLADQSIYDRISEVYKKEGMALDPIYSGKSFNGMVKYLEAHNIKDKNVLYVHTAGTPSFFDALGEMEGI